MSVTALCNPKLPVLCEAPPPGPEQPPLPCTAPGSVPAALWCAVLGRSSPVQLLSSPQEAHFLVGALNTLKGGAVSSSSISGHFPDSCLAVPQANPAAVGVRGRDSPNAASRHRCLLTANTNPLRLSAPTCRSSPVAAWRSGG